MILKEDHGLTGRILLDIKVEGRITEADIKRETQRYLDILGEEPYKPHTVLPIRTVKPIFSGSYKERMNKMQAYWSTDLKLEGDINSETEFWKQYWFREIYRIKYGHNGMCGMQYGYYNYYRMPQLPQFRRHDNDFFALCESCLYGDNQWYSGNRGSGELDIATKGIYILARRRIGKTEKLTWLSYHHCLFNKYQKVAIQSKDEVSGKAILKDKLSRSYDLLPIELKVSRSTNSLRIHEFALKTKDEVGHAVKIGSLSTIETRAPTVTAWEGWGFDIKIDDEWPKTPKGKEIYNTSTTCLVDKIYSDTRLGLHILCGVAGDFDKDGDHAKVFWNEDYKTEEFIRYFVPGWEGASVDEYGNEDIEKAVYRQLKKRANYINAGKEKDLNTYVQKFPLTPDECLMNTSGAILPSTQIYQQSKVITENPLTIFKGEFVPNQNPNAQPIFVPRTTGKVEMIVPPASIKNPPNGMYIAGLDPFDVREKIAGSYGGFIIQKRACNMSHIDNMQINEQLQALEEEQLRNPTENYLYHKIRLQLKLGNMPVLHYYDNPAHPDKFNEQCALACKFFNAKAMIERKPSTAIEYFDKNGHRKYMALKPILSHKMRMSKADFENVGLLMNEEWAGIRLDELYNYYLAYADRVYFSTMLDKAKIYDPSITSRKADNIDAQGLMLIYSKDTRLPIVHSQAYYEQQSIQGYRKISPLDRYRQRMINSKR